MRSRNSYLTTNAILPLKAALFWFALFIPIIIKAESSQQTPTPVGDTFSAESLSSREQELRRKEQELLNSMGLQASLSASDAQSHEEITNSKDGITENTAAFERRDGRLQYLKTMGEHPALEKRKQPPTPPTPLPRIKTYGQQGAFGESTAKRLDTFRRTDTTTTTSPGSHYGSKRAINVSLNEIEREIAARSASLNREEIATIHNSATKLLAAPTTKNAVITNLPQFSEVAIDYRSGDWYRVKTSSGQRGWVKGGALLFDAGISKSSAVRIGAVSHVRGTRPSP